MRRPTLRLATVSLLCAAFLAGGCKAAPVAAAPGSSGPPTVRVTPGHTTATLAPGTAAVPSADLDAAAKVLADRFADAGLPRPTVTVNPDGTLGLVVPARMTADEIASLAVPGELTFRGVLGVTSVPPSATPVPADTASGGDPATLLAAARAAVGSAAYDLAGSLTAPATDDATLAELAHFATLTPAEVAVLPTRMQFNVPTVSCAQLDARNTAGVTAADQPVTGCDAAQPDVKYLLDAATVAGTDLKDARADYDPTNFGATGSWYVTLNFTDAGQSRWTDLTAAQVNKQVAIMVDTSVISAPVIEDVIHGPAVISGPTITEPAAHHLAAVLTAGALPERFRVTDVTTTS